MPRQVLPGQTYLVTRRCTQRQFLLRPDDQLDNAFIYCLVEAAQRFEIDILMTFAASNHHHAVVHDPHGCYPAFLEHFHKMTARVVNALRGRWENLWAAEEPCVTRLLDRETVIAKLVYVASNPVKDGLVERAHQWPGVNAYRNLLSGKPLRARRPIHFFRKDGVMPETVELHLTIPAALGPAQDVLAAVRAGVEAVERSAAEERMRTGARVVGRRRILHQSWRDSPTSVAPRRNLRPRFAGQLGERVTALLCYREFLGAYRDARRAWLAHARGDVMFPLGTYWLARFAPVALAPRPA